MFEKEAEEYAKTNALKGLSYRQITETYDEISGYPYFLEDKIKQAYLAGVEAGKPKWHKVADGDLPNHELEKENAELKDKVERYYCMLEKSMDCETCKYCDLSDDRKEEPCSSCFFDSSKWELKE